MILEDSFKIKKFENIVESQLSEQNMTQPFR